VLSINLFIIIFYMFRPQPSSGSVMTRRWRNKNDIDVAGKPC